MFNRRLLCTDCTDSPSNRIWLLKTCSNFVKTLTRRRKAPTVNGVLCFLYSYFVGSCTINKIIPDKRSAMLFETMDCSETVLTETGISTEFFFFLRTEKISEFPPVAQFRRRFKSCSTFPRHPVGGRFLNHNRRNFTSRCFIRRDKSLFRVNSIHFLQIVFSQFI